MSPTESAQDLLAQFREILPQETSPEIVKKCAILCAETVKAQAEYAGDEMWWHLARRFEEVINCLKTIA